MPIRRKMDRIAPDPRGLRYNMREVGAPSPRLGTLSRRRADRSLGSRAQAVSDVVRHLEHWLDRKELAEHLGCKERWIRYRQAEGMPHALIAGRVKFKVSLVEPWLEEHGHLKRLGESEAA